MSRGSDTICRYSGTVFAIALADTSSAGAKAFADNVLKAVEAEAFKAINGETLQITVSIGIAEFPIDAEGVDELISKSETALSEAKIEGRNRWKAA